MIRTILILGLVSATAHAQCPDEDDPACAQALPPTPPPIAPPTAPPQLMLPAPGTALGDGWTLARDAKGMMYRERTSKHRLLGVWISGLSVLTVFWLTDGVTSSLDGNLGSQKGIGFLPVVGSFMAAGVTANHCAPVDFHGVFFPGCSNDTLQTTLYAVYGVAQAAALAMLIAGASVRRTHHERQPVLIVPGVARSGAGITATVRF